MDYIIHPLWFYLIDVLDNLRGIFYLLGIGVFLARLIINIERASTIEEFLFPKTVLTTSIFFIILATLLPTKEALYQMLIASLLTTDNIAWVGETAKDVVEGAVKSIIEASKAFK